MVVETTTKGETRARFAEAIFENVREMREIS